MKQAKANVGRTPLKLKLKAKALKGMERANVEPFSHNEDATKIEGTVTLRKASARFGCVRFSKRLPLKLSFQLVSSDQIDEDTSNGKCGTPSNLEWNSAECTGSDDSTHRISFDWANGWGTPGAVLVINNEAREFFLKELTITVPKKGEIRFLCNSWIYQTGISERVFFANNSYLPVETPSGLVSLRNAEVERLRGDGKGKRKASDGIYDYDVYNDIDDRDLKVLGGSQEIPYPRRCRTGRPLLKISKRAEGPPVESRKLQFLKRTFYIPSDEQFPPESLSDFRANRCRAFSKVISGHLLRVKKDFEDLEEVKKLYGSPRLPGEDVPTLKFQHPNIIREDYEAWRNDEEFARQTLAGVNPMVIRCLKSFPPSSDLDTHIYGPRESSISAGHILQDLDGMSVEQAIKNQRLFILDYYDAYIPYVELINKHPSRKTYATRTIFFLADTGTLNPVAIELCLPPTLTGLALRRVYTPDYSGEDEGWLWQLAKSHVRGNDSGYHQLVNHWLRTHAIIEPFIIATQRNLSKLHPLHKLLLPHFRNTMYINASARQSLINAGGIIDKYFTSGKYSMEISVNAYREWQFNEQGLPADLLKRGMAVPDPNGLRLVIEDYPYAVDGLEIWAALKSWVSDYTSFYYKDDLSVQSDTEVQTWWKEIVEVGHGDRKHDERGWYKMNSVKDMTEAITTLIWIASAHHAAVNFGQYGYAGFMPNHPTFTRKLIPEEGDKEYGQFLKNKEQYFFKTVSNQKTTVTVMAVLEILSQHSSDEIYLGQDPPSKWAADPRVEEAFRRFRSKLEGIEKRIKARNNDPMLKNRRGPANVPYTLLYPATSDDPSHTRGLTFTGIPNSVSI